MNTLFSRDPLFWALINHERLQVKIDKNVGYPDIFGIRLLTERRRDLIHFGYGWMSEDRNRPARDDDTTLEVIKDLNTILEENCYTSGKTWLLWRLIFDEDDFHAVARKVCKQHEASLKYK